MSTLIKIKKRNGSLVDFDEQKILLAIQKAFTEVYRQFDEAQLEKLTDVVVKDLENFYAGKAPGVENVQDFVERELMQGGFYEAAKAYIVYRYEHMQERILKKQAQIIKAENNEISIIKRGGNKEQFSYNKLQKSLSYAVAGLEDSINSEALLKQCRAELYDGINTAEISRALIMATRTMIEQDPAYAKAAARLLLFNNYKEVVGLGNIDFANLDKQYRDSFINNLKRGVDIERLDPRLLAFDLEKLADALVIENDDLFVYLGLQTLCDRYFVRDNETKTALETPQAFWMRIAMGASLHEGKNKTEQAIKFYNIMSKLLYTPSTPTLFHAGTPRPQLSSCYLNTVSDTLDNIFKTYADNAQLSKWSGGLGTDWTNLRGTGAYIKGTGVESQGVIPFIKIASDVTVAINRSGRRRGAACVYLETWHYDIESFLELRKNTGDERRRAHDLSTANWVPDLFMKRVRQDGQWTLFSPDETPDLHRLYGKKFDERYEHYEKLADEGKIILFKRLPASDLWKKMLAMLFETGHPWITFKDICNARSPQDHVGVVNSSNLCTEITLNTSENETAVCNLGSLNFAKFVKDGKFDENLVKEVVPIAMRMLDNIIDINFYPTPDAKRSNLKHRPVGLGLRGYQDALYQLNINFDSEQAVEFADYSMEVVAYEAYLASAMLAKERGAYETFAGSKWERGILPQDTIVLYENERGIAVDVKKGGKLNWEPVRQAIKEWGMRNSNCLAVAPTATTANIVGCIPTVEPIYKNLFVKSNQAGDFVSINQYLVEDLKKFKLWDYEMLGKIKYHDGSVAQITEIPEAIRQKYKEVFDISPGWLIKSAAARGKWIDQSQSINIYYNGTSGKELSEIYLQAWEAGLKTTYYLRTLAASQVEKSTVNTTKFGSTHTREAQKDNAFAASAPVPTKITTVPMAEIVVSKIMTADQPPKACLINDPTCESCQG